MNTIEHLQWASGFSECRTTAIKLKKKKRKKDGCCFHESLLIEVSHVTKTFQLVMSVYRQ